MPDRRDLALLLRSRIPLILVETRDERAALRQLSDYVIGGRAADHLPLFRWTVTDGLQRVDIDLAPQAMNAEPTDVLGHIRAVSKPGIYALLDFHPYLKDPVHVRQLKDICLDFMESGGKLVMISPSLKLPPELKHLSASFEMAVPDVARREEIVREVATQWRSGNSGERVKTDPHAFDLLVQNLAGLGDVDVRRLAHNAIADDGVICREDIRGVMQAKYRLLNREGMLSYEYETAHFGDVAGMRALKQWLSQRRDAFLGKAKRAGLDAPRGVVLLGVQGCGKSLAAKATAGAFGTPLLRLEFGALFNKWQGETERNLRDALSIAETMAPVVLWIDELEKGLSPAEDNTGTSQRVLGAFLTWMAERPPGVFVVATANDIDRLPPELVRKGRFDEIFFVDLPSEDVRREIIGIHLKRREVPPGAVDVSTVAAATDGFSGAELEQLIVGSLFAADAADTPIETAHLLEEAARTRPLSVVMAERIAGLRRWAASRTVPAD
ncbi:MAG: AAA family ATPase [Pseudomonadota bacterium]